MNLIALNATSLLRIRMNLDDASAASKVDRSKMIATMEKTPDRLKPPLDAPSTIGKAFEKPRNVVLGGVGGSGIIGDVLTDYMRGEGSVPVSVCRSMRLPAHVGNETLFVGVSYSGETAETLALVDQAVHRDARVLVVASGGKLIQYAIQERLGYLKVTEGLLPRVALPELIGAVVYLMGKAGMINGAEKMLQNSSETLRSQIGDIGMHVPLQRNMAKQAAQNMIGKLPLLLGSEDAGSVLRRFKNELNENSKMPAFYYTLPEAYHDDVEGLKALCQLVRPQPIFLRDKAETAGQGRTRERLYGLFKEFGIERILEFEGKGDDRLQQLLTAIMFGDFVSVYLALLLGVDPSELTLIPRFREAMRGS
jgi:glucose/mannose-6-phosphate isomerase